MKICVFASSSNALDKAYIDEAIELAKLIGKNRQTLVNGGANVGLMHEMLEKAAESGAHTIGIIPEKMQGHQLVSKHAIELHVTKDMMDRKALMREMSDAFIALPGGFGTLEEVMEVITLKQLDYHDKAIVFLNTNGFFNDLFQQFERSFTENFAKESYRDLYFIANNSKEAMTYLETYKPPIPISKWYKVPTNGQR